MNILYDWLIGPFFDFSFMRRALVACFALSFGSGIIGVFLVLRRMSLIGDTMAHSVLPGVAIGFMVSGISVPAMSLGGFLAGFLVATFSGFICRFTSQKEDASFASLFMISLAFGVLLVSIHGSTVDLMHILFGSILAIDDMSLILMASVASVTLLAQAVIFRGLVVECFDPLFLRALNGYGGFYHVLFLVLVVLNMVSGFQALGTLMAVGLIMLPATTARFWVREVWSLICLTTLIAFISGYVGLVISYQFNLPSGPTIVLIAGMIYLFSLTVGSIDGIFLQLMTRRHFRS
ncbi:MAG: metal ABC transporter permease [Rhodospirillaceae bacterium]|jgi:zinc/manganese transport system permease protein|nr:metal ABC transporter permease [Rhodospirillaceae bacterium]